METLARTDLNLIRVGFLILGVRFVVGWGGGELPKRKNLLESY